MAQGKAWGLGLEEDLPQRVFSLKPHASSLKPHTSRLYARLHCFYASATIEP